MLSDANAEITNQGFQSPYSGSSIFADQLHGATLDIVDLTNPGKGFLTNIAADKIRLSGAPTGLTISSYRVDDERDDNLLLTFGCTGNCLSVSSNTSVTVQVERTGYIGWSTLPATPLWYSEGTFTIKPFPKELVTSTPTNSSTVTEAGSTSTFTVKLRKAPSATVTVAISIGDTTEGSVSPSMMTFTTQNYGTAQTVTVTGVDDNIEDGSQDFFVVLDPASSGDSTYNGLSNVNVTMTTTDNESRPSFSIDSPSVTEGDSGMVNLNFTVTASPLSVLRSYTVNWAEGTGGTATSGTDYTAITGGTLTFFPGVPEQTISVSVTGDTVDESNETVVITLSGATSGSTIRTASGTGTILDDDPNFSIDSPSVTEGDSGDTSNLTFTVTLSESYTSALTVDYADAGTGTATSGTDYTAVAGGTLTFAAGETSKTITVPVTGDTADEGASETVVLTLSNATAGTGISTATGTGTITDNDPQFSIADASATEGDSGSVNMTFTVTLSGAGSSSYTVDYASSDGTATAGTDYTAVSGTLTFAAGTTSRTFTVSVTGDTVNEANETLTVTLSNASAGTSIATASATGTITDNDTPSFSIDSPSVTEGDSGSVNLTFTVSLNPAPAASATVDYARTGGTATSGTDFTALSASTLTFAAGTTSQTITVSVRGDTLDESNETVVLTLSSASSGSTIGTATGTGTITDDDPKFSINSPSVTEGDSGSANLVFTVTLSAAGATQHTVGYAQTGGTATSGTDYTAVTANTLTFAAGTTTQTITVSVTGDTTDESNETVVITLSNASSGTAIATAIGTGTIRDDDPNFSINSPSVVEGDSGSVNLVFTVTLSAASMSQYTVDYAQTGGTATSGTDYTAVASNTLTFAANTTTRTVTVSVTGDTVDEGNETVVITLSNPSSGTVISTATGTGTITDDDPKFSINSPTVAEGDSSTTNLTFTVTLSAAGASQHTVGYAQTGGTATSGTDYTAVTAGVLTFAAGTMSRTITVSVTGDTVDEGNETVVLTLSNASSGTVIATATGTGTITDDDPKFSINSPSVVEGDSSSVNLVFTVTLSAASTSPLTVDYARTGGTATSGTDYTAVSSSTLTFAANSTSETITVSVTGDTVDEGNETVVLTLSNATAGTGISTATGTGTIMDDDPKFSINSPTVTEGDSSSVNLVFTVTLNAPSTSQLTVDYASSDGSTNGATAGTDYTAVSGTLTFSPGTTSRTIAVSVTGDTANEANETVVITLSDATSGAGIATATGTGTITDNDTPNFSINSPSVAEGNSGSANLVFTVTLSPASATQVTVNYADAGTGTATSGTDYTALSASNTLTFTAGTTTQTITVSVTGDTSHEADETVVITLSGASTGTNISTATGTGTITNDDSGLAIDSPSVTEGDSGSANLVFTVTLDPASASQVTVNYARTGGTATSGTDFTALAASTTLTFSAGETSKTITVSVTGDTINEADETVIVTLSGASGADIDTASGTGTITDDDTPMFSINSPSVVEGDSGSADLEFTVTLSPASYQATTVDYATATAGTATAGTDFTAITATTLTFAAGDTSKTFMVSVTGDTTDEGASETVVVALSDATGNAEIGTSSGTGTITDDDPKFSIGNASATEGDTGSVNMTFTVTLSGAGNSQYTVDYVSSDGTATAGADYTAVSGTLTFAAGTTSRTLTVSVTGDTANEANETVIITLSNASAGTAIATASGTGTITDNDTPNFSINSPSVAEGDSSTTNLVFTVTLSPASATQVTVDYADAGTGTATSGTDYTALASSTTLTFAAGTTTQTITVSVSGDTTHEADETVALTLSNASTGTNISTASGTGTITNDDSGLAIDSPSVVEGDGGSVNLVFTVTLAPASSSQVTVNYADAGTGTATSGTDYTALAASTTLTFAAGDTSETITVLVTGDTINEADETVIITLSSASGADLVTATGTGTITDNDTPSFSIDSPSVAEGDSGSATLTFTVSLSPASYQPVTVDYAQTGGTATSGIDYTAVTGSMLTFAATETSKTFTVSVTGDTLDESNETVVVTLSSATAGTNISTASGTGTILDDDPKFSIDSPSVTEGDSGSVNLVFTVTLSASSTFRHTVDYADAGTGTASSGTDYAAVASGTLTFAPGVTSRTIAVSVTGDAVVESNETVVLTLSNALAAGIATASGTGTITDNETPNFSINSPRVAEGGTGDTPSLTFTVTLSPASAAAATVAYAFGGTATGGTDYATISGGTLTFAAGTTTQTIAVSVTGDTTYEPDETVVVTLSSPSGAGLATATGTGTIANDDPGLSIDSPTVTEGNSGSVNLVFTVTLAPSSSSQVTVSYASSDGTTNGATAGTDYTAVSGTLTFAANDTSETITVSVTGDTAVEPDETVIVTLSSASGADIATASGTGTIRDDDTPSFSIDSPSVAEGGTGDTRSLTFTVTLSPAPAAPATVSYVSSDGTANGATAGTDYTAVSGTLTFAAGAATQTIAVPVTGDADIEPNETVAVTLSNASAGTRIATAVGTGTIRDDDRPAPPAEPAPPDTSSPPVAPGFSIDSPSVAEGDRGSVNLTFTVSLSPASDQQATVNYASSDGTANGATAGTDYTAVSGTLTFAAGETSKPITVSVTGDTEFEPDETVAITLSDASTGTRIETAIGTGTITDNDTPGFSIDSPSVEEANTGSVNLTFTVTLTPASYEQASVDYASSDGTENGATAGTDYTAVSGTLTFAAGETSKPITVLVTGDTVPEENETVVLVLSNPNPSSYTIEEARGTGTIADNDDAAVLDEVDTEIVAEVAREVTTSVVTAVGNRIASVVGGAAIAPPVGLPPINVPPTGGFADGGLLSILERSAQHSRERERGLERSEMSLYRSLDGASFVYTPSVAALGANGSADASGGMLAGASTVWGSVDYRKLSGGGADALQWDGELASVNIGTDTMVDSGVLVGLAAGISKGSFGYQGSAGGTSGVVKVRVKSLNPYIGWSVSESASLWAAVGYGKGKVNYNDGATGEAASKMSIASAALGGRYRLLSNDAALCNCLIQVDLKAEAWGLQTRVDGDERRPMGSKSRAHGARVAIERLQSSALESGASLTLSGEAGLRWDGGDGDAGTGIEMGGTAEYRNPATRMKVVATGRALLDHESDRKEWGAGLTAGYRLESREIGLTYSSSVSHGQLESEVDSLWDSRVASRASEDAEPTTRLDAEVGYRMFGSSGLHTPYVGIGVEEGSKRDYRIGMRYASESELSSSLEFERREASGKRPDHRVMLTGQIDW